METAYAGVVEDDVAIGVATDEDRLLLFCRGGVATFVGFLHGLALGWGSVEEDVLEDDAPLENGEDGDLGIVLLGALLRHGHLTDR